MLYTPHRNWAAVQSLARMKCDEWIHLSGYLSSSSHRPVLKHWKLQQVWLHSNGFTVGVVILQINKALPWIVQVILNSKSRSNFKVKKFGTKIRSYHKEWAYKIWDPYHSSFKGYDQD